MILESGELDTRIALQLRSDKQEQTYGSVTGAYEEVGAYWGKLSVLTPRNVELAKGFAPTVGYEVKLRYCPAATNECDALIRGKRYSVNGVVHDPAPRPAWTQLFLTKLEQ